MFNFKPERIKFNQIIGSGASGTVYAYQKDPEDKRSVVKNITTRNTKDALKSIQEIVLGFRCDNQYVLPVTGYHIDYNETKMLWDVYIKLPRMKDSLKSVLMTHKKNKEALSEDKIVQYSYAIILGVQYLHTKKIAHRDIKPENVLLDENGKIKIADFGLGHFMGDATSCNVFERSGSLFYAAPENQDDNIQLDNKKLLQADLWSLGMLMLELCILDLRSLDWSLAGKAKEVYLTEIVVGLAKKYSEKLLKIISRLLRYDPSERVSLREIQRELEQNYADILNTERRHKTLQVDFPKSECSEHKKLLERIKDLENELIQVKKSNQDAIVFEERKDNNIQNKEQPLLENVEIWAQKFQQKWEKKIKIQINQKEITINFDPKAEVSDDIANAFLIDFNKTTQDPYKESLRGLKIDLANWETEKVNKLIKDVLTVGIGSKQDNLLHFRLDASSRRQMVNDDTIEDLAAFIGANMPNLQTLALNVSSGALSFRITDRAIKAIAERIIPFSKHITNLELGFNNYDKIGDDGLAQLASQLDSNLKSLLQLSLNFRFCYNMTNNGLKEFACKLGAGLRHLQNLVLDIRPSTMVGALRPFSITEPELLEYFEHVPQKTIRCE